MDAILEASQISTYLRLERPAALVSQSASSVQTSAITTNLQSETHVTTYMGGCSSGGRAGQPLIKSDNLQIDAAEFSTILYLLMNHNQDPLNFKLENKIIKNACMRTNSKGLDVKF
ncbi:Fc receptor-like protein [Sarotherodon galilaeus]